MAARTQTTPRKQAVQRRSTATVQAILDATARVLVKEGYDRASTNRVAEAAGVSIGSLYQYFPNKEALVAALVLRHVEEMSSLLARTMEAAQGAPLLVAVRTLIRAMIAAHAVNPKLHKVLVEQTPRVGRIGRLHDVECYVVGLAKAYFAANEHALRPLDKDLAAFVLVTALEALTHEAVLSRPDLLEDDRFVDEVAHLVEAYLRPHAPPALA